MKIGCKSMFVNYVPMSLSVHFLIFNVDLAQLKSGFVLWRVGGENKVLSGYA